MRITTDEADIVNIIVGYKGNDNNNKSNVTHFNEPIFKYVAR